MSTYSELYTESFALQSYAQYASQIKTLFDQKAVALDVARATVGLQALVQSHSLKSKMIQRITRKMKQYKKALFQNTSVSNLTPSVCLTY